MANIRTKKLQLLAGLLAVAMLLQLAPFAALKAWAAEAAYYIDRDGNRVAAEGAREVTKEDTTWTDGTYIVTGDVEIEDRVTVNGDVVLILADGCYLQIPQGITVSEGNTLVIYGQEYNAGQLVAGDAQTMPEGAAGIGGYATLVEKYENQQDGAQHNTPSATYEDKEATAGTIEINGGMVSAYGGASSAGIGSGAFDETNQTSAVSCTVEINGGTVTAKGGEDGAGIGGGQYANGGKITIRGKDTQVNAIGYTGIGGGNGGAAGTITIEAGTVKATGQSANGIGTGNENDDSPESSRVTIRGGKVTARSNYFGAGIKANTVTIEEGEVTANGTHTQTGIEGTTIAISGGTVVAASDNTGAGINGSDTVEISGGTVTAKGGAAAAGINSASGTIKISGGNVTATGGATGTGINSDSGIVEISGGTVTATGSGAGIGGTGGTAMVCGGNVTATGSSTGIGTGTFTTTAEDGTGGNAFIVASSISDNADTANWSGVIFQDNKGEVYGSTALSPLTLTQSATVPSGATLHIAQGAVLRLDKNVQLIVDNATLDNEGQIVLRTGAYVGGTGGAQIVDEDGIVYEESDMLSGSVGAGTKYEDNGGAGTGTGAKDENGGALVALLLGGGIAAGTAVYFYVRSLRTAAAEEVAGEAAEDAAEEATEAADQATADVKA